MKKHVLALVVILVTQRLFAVESSTQKLESTTKFSQTSPKNLVSLDGFPMLLGGGGVGFDRMITTVVTLGIFAAGETLKAVNSADNEMKFQSTGIRTRYFTDGDASDSGWYFGGALVSVNLKTSVRVLPTDIEGSASDRKTGFLAMGGYQIRGNDFGSGRFILDLGLLAGTGLAAKFEAKSFGGVSQVNTTIGNGLSAEAALGFLF